MMKIKVLMEMEILINEDMEEFDNSVQEDMANGDIILGHMKFDMLDEDGNSLLEDETHHEMVQHIVKSFT